MNRVLFPLILLGATLLAQQGPGVPQPAFQNDLLDQLVGIWDLSGEVRNQPVRERVYAQWVLGHHFMLVHRKQVDGPYEAYTYIGYDAISERLVAHLVDTFGGRGSETLGYGIRTGDKIQFVFEYPTGPYHYTMSFDSKEKTWQFLLESKNTRGQWTTFSTQTLHRAKGRGPQP